MRDLVLGDYLSAIALNLSCFFLSLFDLILLFFFLHLI